MNYHKKVIKNTVYLYVQIIASGILVLFSTPILLRGLGEVDYGIFNLIFGVVTFLSFINGSMALSVQRYFSHAIGANQCEKLKSIFQTSFSLHLVIGFLLVLVLEVVGFFIFDSFLKIPSDRIESSKLLYQLMIALTFITVVFVPYDAAITANEDFKFLSVVNITNSLLRLVIAYLVLYYSGDNLIFYGALFFILLVTLSLVKAIFSHYKYDEVTFEDYSSDKILLKEIATFAGWNTFGALARVGKNQGLAIVLNNAFGVTINSAYAISSQINSQLLVFSSSMLRAVQPLIIKKGGSGETDLMLKIATLSSKYAVFLLALFALPIIFEMPYILKLWLGDVPEYTIVFSRLVLISTLISLTTVGLQTAVQATGKIKWYQIVLGLLQLSCLPLSYILFKCNYPPQSAFFISISLEVLTAVGRLLFMKSILSMSIRDFISGTLLRLFFPIMVVLASSFLINTFIEEGTLRFVIMVSSSILLLILSFAWLGLESFEKKIIMNFIKRNK